MNQIKYSDIIALGFQEDHSADDKVYEDMYGYPYVIITKELTDTIYIEWEKETRLCKLIRIDHPDKGNIVGRMDVKDIDHLNEMINFFENQ